MGQNKQFACGHAVIVNAKLHAAPEKQCACELSVLFKVKLFVLLSGLSPTFEFKIPSNSEMHHVPKNSSLCLKYPRVRIAHNHNTTRLQWDEKQTIWSQSIQEFVYELLSLFVIIRSIVWMSVILLFSKYFSFSA